MKLGIVIYSNDSETVWNDFRLEIDTENFKVTEQIRTFVENGGKIFACGTCLKIRQLEGSEICVFSTMKDLYEIAKESDKLVTF